MPQYIPPGFKCTPEIERKYMAVRSDYLPLIKSKVRTASAGGLLDYDDLLQEGEMAMVYAVAKHDPTKGTLLKWIGFITDNVIRMFLSHAYAQSRLPRVWEWDGEAWQKRIARPTSLEGCADDNESNQDLLMSKMIEAQMVDALDPETLSIIQEGELRSQHIRFKFRRLVESRLGGFAKLLFWARVDPPVELLVYIRNLTGRYPSNSVNIRATHVAKFYGVSAKVAQQAGEEIKRVSHEVLNFFSLDELDCIFAKESGMLQ